MVLGVIAGGPPALVRSVGGRRGRCQGAGAAAMDALSVRQMTSSSGSPPAAPRRSSARRCSTRRARGARTAFLSCTEPPAALRGSADECITCSSAPRCVTGSTRMKAGTATKLVLNTITSGAMIRLGKVYGNLMVDLRAWNEKLVDRSRRIVMETTGISREAAGQVIEDAGGSVKTAIVMARRGGSRAEAERLLEEHEGRLRPIVGDPPPMRPA